jgi:hypothetical protein
MPPTAAWTHTETQGVNLRVPRRTRTFARILGAVADAPDRSLSAALGPGLRQAGHALFASPRTSVPALLSGHLAATVERCRSYPLVLIAQDTTAFV